MEAVDSAAQALARALTELGLDVQSDGLADTPRRVVRAWVELTRGYAMDPETILGTTFEADGYDQVIALRGISFSSLCEHHLLPFVGTVGIAYLPRARVVGLSKLARLVDCFALRVQIQERMTKEIADALEDVLGPRGTVVVVRAEHSCMATRGVRKPGTQMVTSDVRGLFLQQPAARAEVFALLE